MHRALTTQEGAHTEIQASLVPPLCGVFTTASYRVQSTQDIITSTMDHGHRAGSGNVPTTAQRPLISRVRTSVELSWAIFVESPFASSFASHK